jgi:hypothetical protein
VVEGNGQKRLLLIVPDKNEPDCRNRQAPPAQAAGEGVSVHLRAGFRRRLVHLPVSCASRLKSRITSPMENLQFYQFNRLAKFRGATTQKTW